MIYFLSCSSPGLVKIGYTSGDPDSRYRRLASLSPAPLVTLGTMPGSRDDERKLHLRFLDLWSHGEWFRVTPELIQYLEAIGKPWEAAPLRHVRRPSTIKPSKISSDEWAAGYSLTIKGETRTALEWSRLSGVSTFSMRCRVERGVRREIDWLEASRIFDLARSGAGMRKVEKRPSPPAPAPPPTPEPAALPCVSESGPPAGPSPAQIARAARRARQARDWAALIER